MYRTLVIWFAFLCGASVVCCAMSQAPRHEREAAVAQARTGNAKAGLAVLRQLLRKYPDDPRLLTDAVIVANWAGDDALALRLYEAKETPTNEAGSTEAAARSARNLHQYARAAALYRHAQSIAPERWQPRLGEALVMVDEGDYPQATPLMKSLLRNHHSEKDVLTGEAYLCEREGDSSCVIAMDQYLLDQDPTRQEPRCQMAIALSRLGGASRALRLCAAPPPQIGKELQEAVGAEYVRWGETYSSSRETQKAESATALSKLNQVASLSQQGTATWRAAQFDRILALHDLERMGDVVAAYETLRAGKIEVPNYALVDVADAYLQLHKPRQAAALYRVLIERSPHDGAPWSGLAYAQFESGRMRQSLATIDHAFSMTPVWLQAPGVKVQLANHMYTSLGEQAALMRGYADLLDQEYRRQKKMLDLAPANVSLRRNVALTELARGWPVRALTEARIADNYAMPDDLPSLASAEIDEAVGRRDEVDAMLPALRQREFDSPELQRFIRGTRLNRGWQFDAQAGYGWGSGIEVGANDNHSEAHLYTPLIHNRFRLYGHELSDGGQFITETATHTRSGLGLRYDYDRKAAWAEFAYDDGTDVDAGNLGAEADLGNLWSVAAEFDTDSFDVPTRALTGRTHGRSGDISVTWHENELRSASIHLQRVLFSDGNQRAALPAAWSERIFTSPRLQETLRMEEWASHDSRDENRPYFNPRSDFSLGPRATLDWLTWQDYGHSLTQEFGLYASPYWQQNYGVDGAAALHYEQRWGVRVGTELHWGLTWNTQPYDGVNEHRTAFEAGVRWGSQ